MKSNVEVAQGAVPDPASSEQRTQNAAARQLIREWLADESGYDEATWPIAQRAIEANRLSTRPRFDG